MTPEENGMVSLVELRQEVAALDTASVQDARARLDKFLSQFGDGKYCEICYRDNNDYFTQEAEYNVFGARHTFYHDDYKGHKKHGNQSHNIPHNSQTQHLYTFDDYPFGDIWYNFILTSKNLWTKYSSTPKNTIPT